MLGVGLEVPEALLQRRRLDEVVVVDEEDVLSPSVVDAGVAGRAGAALGFLAEDADARVPLFELGEELGETGSSEASSTSSHSHC